MDRTILRQHLAEAERHVAEGERHLARQRRIVAELERQGHPSNEARTLHALFQELQASHVADRHRLREELATPPTTARVRFTSPNEIYAMADRARQRSEECVEWAEQCPSGCDREFF